MANDSLVTRADTAQSMAYSDCCRLSRQVETVEKVSDCQDNSYSCRLGTTSAGRPLSSAPGRADEDDDKVADEMGEEEDRELRCKDSRDLLCTAKTQ